MTVVKSIPNKKLIHGSIMTVSDTAIVSESLYQTNGESFILVKDVPLCRIKLDSRTTEHVTIKAMTSVIIIPDINGNDEVWDEVSIDKGTCVEFYYMSNHWYIFSSDGLKLN